MKRGELTGIAAAVLLAGALAACGGDGGEKTQLVHTGFGSVHGTAWEQKQGG